MQKFGEIFKKFRESRGIRLKDVAKAGISTSQLSRFEKGQTDLTITKFMLILDEINMPIDEFMYAVHDFHRDDLNELLSKIRLFVSTHDIDGLKKLLNSQLESEPKKEGSNQSIIEMKRCIDAIKLVGSKNIAKTYEAHLKKLIDINS